MSGENGIQSHCIKQEVQIVELAGVLDVSLQAHLKDGLLRLAEEESDLVLDFSKVKFIDSSCLGVLVSLLRTLREKNGNICLINLSPDVESIFQVTRLDRVFQIHESIDTAIDSFFK